MSKGITVMFLDDRTRRGFLKKGMSTVLSLGLSARAVARLPLKAFQLPPLATHDADHPAVHGMVMVGERRLYLSHLPLFRTASYPSPHDYQVILEARLTNKTGQLEEAYVDDRRRTGENLYTLEPEKFVLSHLISAESGSPPLRRFRASVYRGHFERGGIQILENAVVEIIRIIHMRRFTPDAARPDTLQYLLFGGDQELFLAHYISGPPDFDQILKVAFEPPQLTRVQPEQELIVKVPQRSNDPGGRLRENQKVQTEIVGLSAQSGSSIRAGIAVHTEFYFEDKELTS
jgi:hypothetical protein